MSDILRRLREPSFGTETSERNLMAAAADEIERLRKREQELVEALEPFAQAADVKLCGHFADDEHFGRTDVSFYLTFGDLRRAARTISQTTGESL